MSSAERKVSPWSDAQTIDPHVAFDFDDPRLKHLTAEQSRLADAAVRAAGAVDVRINSRHHVIGFGGSSFWKSLTGPSMRRVASFYPQLEARASVPRARRLIPLAVDTWLVEYESIRGRNGTQRDSQVCLNAYARAQREGSAAMHAPAGIAMTITQSCLVEIQRWDEYVDAWDEDQLRDPRILQWSGRSDWRQLRPSLRVLRQRIEPIVDRLEDDGLMSPVHADLSVDNMIVTPSGRCHIIDWDEGYWGLPGMGLQILLREADQSGRGLGDFNTISTLISAHGVRVHPVQLAIRTVASAVIEFASVHHSLRVMGRPETRKAAYLAAWARRYASIVLTAYAAVTTHRGH